MKTEKDLSRRNFLKGSILGAGALTTGFGAGLVLPGKAHAAPPVLPLPFCLDSAGNPSSTPNASNIPVLDPDDVRVKAWYYYNPTSAGGMQQG
jgi:hypothetical protein